MYRFKASQPHVYKLNSLISAHMKSGDVQKAVDALNVMIHEGLQPDVATFLSLLKSPPRIEFLPHCRYIHDFVVITNFQSDLIVSNGLIHAYAKYGSLDEAYNIFKRVKERDVMTWGALMFGYIQQGHGLSVIELYREMQNEECLPDEFVYICLLKSCKSARALTQGMQIHADILKRGLGLNLTIGNALIDMYAKCSYLEDASHVFDDMTARDLVSWGALIEGFSLKGHGHQVLELFEALQLEGLYPNKVILLFVVKSCASVGYLEQGMVLHDQAIRSAFDSDLDLGSAFLDLYSSCKKLNDAHKLFSILANKDAVTWGAMIGGYVQAGKADLALQVFMKLQHEGIKPTSATLSSTLKACGLVCNLEVGRELHHLIMEYGIQSNMVISTTVVDMYAKCESFIEAQIVFNQSSGQDIVFWHSIIARYVTQGHYFSALDLFQKMQSENLRPVKTTFLCILKACSSIETLCHGCLIHCQIIEAGLETDLLIANALINLYVKTGCVDDARRLFDQLPCKDFVSWNIMMSGYSSYGQDLSAIKFAEEMHVSGFQQSKATHSSILKVCSNIGAAFQGKVTHDSIVKDGVELDRVVGSALVDMYAKCGHMRDARKVFDALLVKDVVSWGAMTAGYAMHGDCGKARQCFVEMEAQGLHLSESVFNSILVAFTHAGLLEEGCRLFNSVLEYSSEFINTSHYSSMVDLLGRVGQLDDAGDLFQSMPIRSCLPAMRSFLSSCRTHGNSGLGQRCFKDVHRNDFIFALGSQERSCFYKPISLLVKT